MLKALVVAMRPKQWTKNLVIFAGLIFSQNFFHLGHVQISILAFIAFCLNASSIYLINDIKDVEQDKLHPEKKNRPLPAGLISPGQASFTAVILAIGSLALAYWLGSNYGYLLTAYWVMMLFYTFKLKQLVIVDLLVIAAGFIIRALSGAAVLDVVISRWLLVCTIFLALFLILAKRRNEIVKMGDNAAGHRAILAEYGERFLDQMIAVATACTVMSYVLYTLDPETVAKFQTTNLIFTAPFVIYGIFRYLYLVYQKKLGGRPEVTLLMDRSLLFSVFLWIIVSMIIVY
ncbi:decaprenyl-phosphate phosphoribosyltransferase [bacterium]|nr:decaprenyl-phosphate phosphoribosyltransferase [bacterium]